jgi:hypothetical protein
MKILILKTSAIGCNRNITNFPFVGPINVADLCQYCTTWLCTKEERFHGALLHATFAFFDKSQADSRVLEKTSVAQGERKGVDISEFKKLSL